MAGSVTIKGPFMYAWKELGWPEGTKGYGINKNLFESEGDITINKPVGVEALAMRLSNN